MRTGVLFLTILCSAACCFSPKASQASHKHMPTAALVDHRPPAAEHTRPLAKLPSDLEIDLRIVLHSRAAQDADAYAEAVFDPEHPDFGKFLTPEQYMERFGPSKLSYQATHDHLERHGLKVDRTHGHFVHVRGTADQIQDAFGVKLHEYELDGRKVRVPDLGVTAPDAAGIAAVHGLSTPPTRTKRSYEAKGQLGAGPYTATMIRQAYEVPATATGAGQVLGLMQLDSYDPTDIATYCHDNGLNRVPLNNILVGGFDGKIMDPGAQGEVTLDIELMNAMAPGAKEIRVFMGNQATGGYMDILNEMVMPTLGDKTLVKIISSSWGAPEDGMSVADLKAEAILFRQMAIQGQSFFVAAGDDGARDDGRTLSTDDPASQVYTVAVGGTALYTKADGSYDHEKAWSSAGGGISRYWGIPPWQAKTITKASLASARRRNVPDVAFNADPATGYAIYVQGGYQVVGGTSCAAPLWAATWGLVAQARADKGMAPLGFFNPPFYALMASPNGAGVIHDVLDNSTNGYFPSVPGRDNATGWGTVRVGPLLEALTK
jgi:kumamolisin